MTFLYISHHLEEIYEVCRSVTVLRDGGVADAPLEAMPKERVVAAMVGEARAARAGAGRPAPGRRPPGAGPWRCAGSHRQAQPGPDLRVAAGETVGLAGLAGSGKARSPMRSPAC